MRQFTVIAANAFMELARQPVFLLLVTVTAMFEIFLACVPYFGFGDDPKMVKDSVLAVMLLSGLFCAVLCASASISREIRTGTVLAVLAKPIGRALFLLAKYAGVAAALAVMTYVNLVAALLASRMAYDAFGNTNKTALAIWTGFVALAYLLGGLSNYFLRRTFVADTLFFLVVTCTLAFVVSGFFDPSGKLQSFAAGTDWRMAPAGVLILFALWILAAVAVASSTRLELVSTLAICSAVFLLGLMSDFLFQSAAETGSWLAALGQALVPNWQFFWLADAMEADNMPPGLGAYLVQALVYAVGYAGAVLALALWLFEDRELG